MNLGAVLSVEGVAISLLEICPVAVGGVLLIGGAYFRLVYLILTL
jgi:hypothetical protein